jgi:hypothetical protein
VFDRRNAKENQVTTLEHNLRMSELAVRIMRLQAQMDGHQTEYFRLINTSDNFAEAEEHRRRASEISEEISALINEYESIKLQGNS